MTMPLIVTPLKIAIRGVNPMTMLLIVTPLNYMVIAIRGVNPMTIPYSETA